MSTPVHIASIRVDGATHTRRSFLDGLVQSQLVTQSNPTTLESAIHTMGRISQLLHNTDIFHSVSSHLEKSQGPLSVDGDVDIIFTTREKGRLYLNTSTEVGNGEGSAKVTARVRNVFGGAEILEGNLSFGTTTRHSYHALLSAPLTPTLTTRGEVSVFQLERDNSTFASCYEGLRGVRATIKTGSHANTAGVHEFTYEAVLRHISKLSSTASISMREAAGQTLKSSLSHTWIRDTRDDKYMATRGFMTKFFQEFAGLGGQAHFYKAEACGQYSRTLFPGIALSVGARSGFLWSMNGPSLFPDRFQLGGPLSVRLFKINGIGPRDMEDSMGGDLYWSTGVSIISNIPYKPHWPVKMHAFVNAGSLAEGWHLPKSIKNPLFSPSLSAGTGLIYQFDPVRVEVNFGMPLLAFQGDGGRRGIQVGIGLDFL